MVHLTLLLRRFFSLDVVVGCVLNSLSPLRVVSSFFSLLPGATKGSEVWVLLRVRSSTISPRDGESFFPSQRRNRHPKRVSLHQSGVRRFFFTLAFPGRSPRDNASDCGFPLAEPIRMRLRRSRFFNPSLVDPSAGHVSLLSLRTFFQIHFWAEALSGAWRPPKTGVDR